MQTETGDLIQDLSNGAVAFLTRHKKETLLAPIFQKKIGCQIIHIDSIDTDTLGTFTREIPRQGTQREAARKKAELGAELTGCRFGLGSEGSFITDPWTGMMPWNMEMVLLLDMENGREVTGIAQGPGMSLQGEVKDWESLEKLAAQAGFPYHHLIIRPDNADQPVTAKGISNTGDLRAAFEDALSKSQRQQVFVENDLRAHCNPTRQAMIINAAHNLLERLQSACPACGLSDFWITGILHGKPCRSCGKPTRMPQGEQWSCTHCCYTETRERNNEPFAAPAQCEYCNP